MKNLILLTLTFVTLVACNNGSETENQSAAKQDVSIKESPKKSVLETGCYDYNSNGNHIKMDIAEVNEKVTGSLNIAYSEKDASQGEFVGSLKGDKLIGTYTFNAEGRESSREMAFLIKDDQLIEGYGELNENGTKFKDVNTIKYTSTMPLKKTDCAKLRTGCLFKNGQSFSELKNECLELTTLNIKLNPLKDGASTKGDIAYLLFDDTPKLAEVFLPLENKGIILTKIAEGNWSNGDYTLIAWKGYVIQKKGKAIYGGSGT